jgi:urease beta subunit
VIPGEVLPGPGVLVLNAGRASLELDVENTGDRPIQVGSHFHFFEANAALAFERPKAYGCRLDIPSGSAVRFEPGERRRVSLVPLGGQRLVYGLRGLVNGRLDDQSTR